MKLKRNDEVIVTRGKDHGKMGKIEKVLTKEGMVVIPGINVAKRHRKGDGRGQSSEIVTLNVPVKMTNVMFMCPKCHKPSRLGYKMEKDVKVRVCKKCNQTI